MAAKPQPQPGPKERFFRYFQLEVTALLDQMSRLEDLALVGGERSDAADHCLAGIAQLQKEVQDASSYVPAYDQRTYGEAIKALNEKLAETRAIVVPKPKFSFKTVRKNASAISLADAAELASAQRLSLPGYHPNPSSDDSSLATTPVYPATPPNGTNTNPLGPQQNRSSNLSESVTATDSIIHKPTFASSKSVAISSLISQHIILAASASQATSSGSLTKLSRCIIDMSIPTSDGHPFASLTLKNIKQSLLICGSVSGAAHITNVEGSVLVVTTRQFRMHDCKDCVVYLHCSSRPIIEGCHGIRFTPLPRPHIHPTNPSSLNQWDQVDDFKWLRADHSPNWSILSLNDEVPDKTWNEIVPGDPGLSLDTILSAVGIGTP